MEVRLEDLIAATKARKAEQAAIPIAPLKNELPESEEEVAEPSSPSRQKKRSLRDVVRLKVAPASKLLSSMRRLRPPKNEVDRADAPAPLKNSSSFSRMAAALNSSNIQGRRRSVAVPNGTAPFVEEDSTIIAHVSRPPSPGLATCSSEQDAYTMRASKLNVA